MKNQDAVEQYLQSLQKDTPVYLIFYKGKPLEMKSKKCGWISSGAAKNALIHELDCFNSYEDKISSKDIVKELIENKIIEIKEIV